MGDTDSRIATYIDGFNVSFGLSAEGWQDLLWLDPGRLAANLCRPGHRSVACHYFTSRLTGAGTAQTEQKTFLEAIDHVRSCVVHYGVYNEHKEKCRACGAETTRRREKKTDVQIAVTLLEDAFQDRFDTAYLVSGDSDLTPAVQCVLRNTGKRVVVVFPPKRFSNHLAAVATFKLHLTRRDLLRSQLPDEIVKEDGYRLLRPNGWRRPA